MTFRPAPLRAAAILAVGFVVVRVVYRVAFNGAGGDGAVVLPLPEWRLAPPFAHVVIGGAATVDGLADAAASALPIAAVIVAFGVLTSLLDLPRLLARASRRGPVRGLARALAVAWATLPALADAARAVSFAARMRGERGGPRLLTPLLERTLERAVTVAAVLEVRGYGGREREGNCAAPVTVTDAVLSFGGAAEGGRPGASRAAHVRIPEFHASPGTLTVLTGPTGSGKTTVLRAISGLHSHVDGGRIEAARAGATFEVVGLPRAAVPPRDTARTVGVVLQHPRAGFVTDRVADEIGLALELRGVAEVIAAARVREVAERVGITHLLDRPVRALSAGESTLVAIAAAVVDHPIVLVVDEPLADLDAAARTRIVSLLDELAHRAGVAVVVAEHRAHEFAEVADRAWAIEDGALVESAVVADGGAEDQPAPFAEPPGQPVLQVAGLSAVRGSNVVVAASTFAVHAGEVVAIVGPNGVGKSTLLEAIARGGERVRVAGRAVPPGRGARAAVALVPDASDDLFVRDTVAAETRRADRGAGLAPGTSLGHFAELVGRAASGLARQHPRDLSAGQRRVLALVLQTAHDPAVVLVDEPTRGLDPRARMLVLSALARTPGAVIVASHEPILGARVIDVTGAPAALPARVAVRAGSGGMRAGERAEPALRAPASAPRVAGPTPATPTRTPRPAARDRGALRTTVLAAANLIALAAFAWPLVATAAPESAQAAVPFIALAAAPLAALVILSAVDASVRSAHTLAMLAVLAAMGAAVRVASTGVGGVEALFVLLILAGRAFGPRFGMLLGASTIALSALVTGGIGPWLPFQLFACAWVGAGAGLLPRRMRGWAEIGMLCLYGILASYLFGLLMNLWFWPFAVGADTAISYDPGAPLGENLASFLVYSLVTSTVGWDTLRAITTVVGLTLVGRSTLAALRRARPVASNPSPSPGSTSPASA